MRRLALGAFAVAVAVTGAVLIVSLLRLGPVGQAVRPFVVRGHLTAAGGRSHRRGRVWLNVVPAGSARMTAGLRGRPVAVTMAGS